MANYLIASISNSGGAPEQAYRKLQSSGACPERPFAGRFFYYIYFLRNWWLTCFVQFRTAVRHKVDVCVFNDAAGRQLQRKAGAVEAKGEEVTINTGRKHGNQLSPPKIRGNPAPRSSFSQSSLSTNSHKGGLRSNEDVK